MYHVHQTNKKCVKPLLTIIYPLSVNGKDGKMMFSLEANNLVDENGNSKQTQMPYFENGK